MWHKKAYADLQVKVNDWGPLITTVPLTSPSAPADSDFSYAMRKPRFGEVSQELELMQSIGAR